MSATNSTTHYSLPQYVATDHPKYLTDFNETMLAIDNQMYTNATAAATADGKAVAAQNTADANTSSIGTLNTQINGDPADPSDTGLAGDVSAVEGNVNTINSLIGNGTPTTTDKTIIGAINEVNAHVGDVSSLSTTDKSSVVAAINEIVGGQGGGIVASAVSYDNTTSGLTADDVQEAIDEVNAKIVTPEADDIVYDNQTSGLAATNVQAAIDEIAQGAGSAPKLVFDGAITTSSASYNFTDTVDYTHKNLLVVGTRAADTPGLQRGAGVVYTSFGMTAAYFPVVSSPTASGIISISSITGSTFNVFAQNETAIDHIKIYEI